MKYQNNCESSNDQQIIRTVDKVTLISRGSVCVYVQCIQQVLLRKSSNYVSKLKRKQTALVIRLPVSD